MAPIDDRQNARLAGSRQRQLFTLHRGRKRDLDRLRHRHRVAREVLEGPAVDQHVVAGLAGQVGRGIDRGLGAGDGDLGAAHVDLLDQAVVARKRGLKDLSQIKLTTPIHFVSNLNT